LDAQNKYEIEAGQSAFASIDHLNVHAVGLRMLQRCTWHVRQFQSEQCMLTAERDSV
jgi:hypothetical protein